MPRIFELFGYPISDQSLEAAVSRSKAHCPFMNRQCDGGGNRYSSQVELGPKHALYSLFPGLNEVPAGVCSIQTQPGTSPWIVCPRRLLALGRETLGTRKWQAYAENQTLKQLGYPPNTRIGVWSEIKIKYEENEKSFDYTFDYILAPIGSVPVERLSEELRQSERVLTKSLQSAGYCMAYREGKHFVEDFPIGVPSLVEIMTSSTSGGNKRKRTTVAMAFEDAVLGKEHEAPGINYRQVWARMVSQLIVKSEVALAWGGKAIWVVQDNLVEYICRSTALDIRKFVAEQANEVNMLSFSYGDIEDRKEGVIDLVNSTLYAGPISAGGLSKASSFQDMIRTPLKPSVSRLYNVLQKQCPKNIVMAR